jgi:hypothetical protein
MQKAFPHNRLVIIYLRFISGCGAFLPYLSAGRIQNKMENVGIFFTFAAPMQFLTVLG